MFFSRGEPPGNEKAALEKRPLGKNQTDERSVSVTLSPVKVEL